MDNAIESLSHVVHFHCLENDLQVSLGLQQQDLHGSRIDGKCNQNVTQCTRNEVLYVTEIG